MSTELKIDKLDCGDGIPLNGANGNDKFSKDNLKEVGVSPELAAGLDGKTITQFKEILVNHINNDETLNPEVIKLGKEIFASYHNTGYEDKGVNAVISAFEHEASDAYPKPVQGLVYDYKSSSAVTPEGEKAASLPDTLKPAEAPIKGTGYGGMVTGTDRGLKELGL